MGGGILYNKKIYDELGLSVPKTWAEFMANNEKIKAAGKVAGDPDLRRHLDQPALRARRLLQRAGRGAELRRATTPPTRPSTPTTPAAMRASSTARKSSRPATSTRTSAPPRSTTASAWSPTGEGAHYPMLTFAIGGIAQNYPENLDDVGFFAQPGDDAATNGLTVWMPAASISPRPPSTPKRPRSSSPSSPAPRAATHRTAANGATGPYLIKGCTLPADVPPAGRRHAALLRAGRRNRAGARIPVADQGPGARADHRRSRLGHPPGRRCRGALRRGRARSRRSSSASRAGKRCTAD